MIRRGLKILLLAAVAAGGWIYFLVNTPVQLPKNPLEFTLKHGSSLRSVAKQLSEAGALREPWAFTLLARLKGREGDVKAGNYALDRNVTPLELLYIVTRGDVSQSEITFIEGWTFKQMRKALDEHAGVKHDSANLSDQEILKRVGGKENVAEGLFYPDTYYFSGGMSDISILRRAYQAMQTKLASAWQERKPDLPFATPYEALIMASIVEKETGQAKERPLIAAVFINRLRRNMRLQTDPTVIYGLGDKFDGNLRKRDLTTDTIYNTYTRSGLPPTPIAMPGWGAIYAVFHPADTPALYFVGKGDGSHQFSASLVEHNRAVARYQLNNQKHAERN